MSTTAMQEMSCRWRLPEFVGLGVVLVTILLVVESMPEYQQIVPPVNTEGVNSYPVRLDSEWCTASQLSVCPATTHSACCTKLTAGVQPGETVPTSVLWLVYFGFPFVFILVREALRRGGRYRGVGTLPDALLGLAYALGLCVVTTNIVKIYVGRPRPNYSALTALATYGSSTYSDLTGESMRSFPSGHASESMAGTVYVTMLCWADLARRTHGGRQAWRRTLLSTMGLLPVFLGLWVGMTRIRDYWHFQDDVLAGWIIGASSAVISMHWVTLPARWNRPARDDSSTSSLHRSGALALMMGESGDGDNGSDMGRPSLNGESECDARNIA